MKRIVCKSFDEMSRLGAYVFAEQIWRKPDSLLGFSTGGTPVGMYKCLIDMYDGGMVDFSRVITFNMDEYYPISKINENSRDYYMWHNLFSHINVRRERVHLPNGGASHPQKACDEYEKLLKTRGNIDLQLLGIGRNGHIAFIEPDDELQVNMHLTDLTDNTISANARFFDSTDAVPRQALTMGIGSIMNARRILMLVSGAHKAAAVKQLFSGTVTPRVPASLLQLHPNTVVIMDEEAASLL